MGQDISKGASPEDRELADKAQGAVLSNTPVIGWFKTGYDAIRAIQKRVDLSSLSSKKKKIARAKLRKIYAMKEKVDKATKEYEEWLSKEVEKQKEKKKKKGVVGAATMCSGCRLPRKHEYLQQELNREVKELREYLSV